MRRLQMLEQQSEDRTKSLIGDSQPLKRQVEQLKQDLAEERAVKQRLMLKFNSEVTYYKKELGTLLDHIDRKAGSNWPLQHNIWKWELLIWEALRWDITFLTSCANEQEYLNST